MTSSKSSTGSPLHAAVVGTEDLDVSQGFWQEHIGLQTVDHRDSVDEAFNQHWQLPRGAHTRVAVLADRGSIVGRIVLVEVKGLPRVKIRPFDHQRAYGLINVNFYTADIHAHWRSLSAAGLRAWTAPVRHQMTLGVGSPTEVMFDAPDGIVINLVELSTADPSTEIGRMRHFVANEFGYNEKGFTPVVTTLHFARDVDAVLRFYEQALGMQKFIDEIFASPEQNLFLGFPPDSRLRCTFCRGDHPFGKIAPSQPLNVEFDDLVPRAVLPNIGYVAQSFIVKNLDKALETARSVGAENYTAPVELNVPGVGAARAVIVRAPGSGALQEMIEPLPR